MDVIIYGFGAIGRLIAECCVKRGINIVAAIDINPELWGKLRDFGIDSDAEINKELKSRGEIAFVSTGSFLDSVYPQIVNCLERGFDVISTCETLSFPELKYPELAKKLDSFAKEKGKTVLGAGINPGFLLDVLPVILSATSAEIEMIKAVRSVDPLKRRESFQKKIGIGLKKVEAERMLKEGKISGHVGYAESVALICQAMGFKADKILEGQEIVFRDETVLGIRGWGAAMKDDREKVRVEFHSIARAEEYEEIKILGDNEITWKSTGTQGDLGTAAIIVNLAESVLNARPGLVKITELIPFKSLLK
jgi:4-hydroxy-tetrahydrodipicolinate reductase